MEHYCIIGTSAAGLSAAETIRKIKPKAKITLISKHLGLPYSRVLLPFVLDKTLKKEEIFIRPKNYYSSWNFDFIGGRKVINIEPQHFKIILDNGKKITYENLLIATGAKPLLPDIPGINLNGVFCFRSIKDAENIENYIKNVNSALVIGGGLIGIKIATSLQKRGLNITIVELQNRILPQVLDSTGSSIVNEILYKNGIKIITNASVISIEGKNKVEYVNLSTGHRISCKMVIICIGIKPNIDFLNESQIKINHGIIANKYLQTNIPNIYAAGDVAEVYDLVLKKYSLHPTWPVATEQGRIAGYNMCGIKAPYQGAIISNAFKIKELHIISAGIIEPPDNQKYKNIAIYDEKR
ncbi:MAG: NAD(P)/FAD-dependent oxidoreductase, partial [Thermodesulfobacteriota bacterium]